MSELYVVKDQDDPLIALIKDDPVRPEIPAHQRINARKEIIVLKENNEPAAVVCVSYHDFVPAMPNDLFLGNAGSIAVFYTIWSYKPGAGTRLISQVKDFIKSQHPEINRFVTFSPLTDVAKNFHLKNGASLLQTNLTSANYEYK